MPFWGQNGKGTGMTDRGLPIVTHDDCIVFMVQKSDIGLENDEGSEWWRQCQYGDLIGWYRPKDNDNKGPEAFHGIPEAAEAGYLPVHVRLARLTRGVVLSAQGNELAISSDLWRPTFERRYTVMAAGLRLAMMKGIVRYRGSYSRDSREAGEALRHRLKQYAVVKRYEHNLTFPADIGEKLLSELRGHCERGGEHADSPTGNVYLTGSLPGDKTTLKVHAYRMGPEYGEGLAGRVKVEVVLRKDALKANGLRRVQDWPQQPVIQDRIAKVLKRQWKQVLAMAPTAKAMLCERTGARTDEQLFGFMLSPENTLGGVIRRVTALEKAQERLAREQARTDEQLAREQARTDERLARLEAMHSDRAGLREVR